MRLYRTPFSISGAIYTETEMREEQGNDYIEWRIERLLMELLKRHLEITEPSLPEGIEMLDIVVDSIECMNTDRLKREETI